VPDSLAYVKKANKPISEQSVMLFGNMPRDGGSLLMEADMARKVMADDAEARPFIKRFIGSEELINGKLRYCFWIEDDEADAARSSDLIAQRLKMVAASRSDSPAESTRDFAKSRIDSCKLLESPRKMQSLCLKYLLSRVNIYQWVW
jgi:hypothetical protein